MKKFIFLLCLVSLFSFKPINNPLKGTKWHGILLAPGSVEAIFDYQENEFYVHAGGKVIETSTYEIHSDTIVYNKILGISPYGSTQLGKYI